MCILIVFVCYAYCVAYRPIGICEYLYVLATVRARELNVLKSIYLSLRKVKAQRVTVVEFAMYNRSDDSVGCFEIKVGTNAAQLTNVIAAGHRE